MADIPVLIVGAGPTGLLLAVELARRNAPFHLIDRRTEPLGWDRAAVVKSRSLEIFNSLGLADEFVRRGHPFPRVKLFRGTKQEASLHLDRIDGDYRFNLGLSEEETENILTGKLAELGHRIERGVEFEGLEQKPDKAQARLKGPDGQERTIDASWIVGTDGVHSSVRSAIDDAFVGKDYEPLWAVVDGRLEGWRHGNDMAVGQLVAPVAMAIPIRKDRWRIYFVPETTDDEAVPRVVRRLETLSPGVTLEEADEPQYFHAHSRVAERFRVGRVLLAGDAAHVCSPLEGHGMNMGLHDAHNLGWKLALVVNGQAPESLIDSYESERRPVDAAIAESGDEAEARLLPGGEAALQEAIDFLNTDDGAVAAAAGEAELALGYEQSPIIDVSSDVDEPDCTKVGFRAKNAKPVHNGGSAIGLHDLLHDTGHTVFLLMGDADPSEAAELFDRVKQAINPYAPHIRAFAVTKNQAATPTDSPDWLHDPDGALHRCLAGGQPSLCAVRPDHHLGYRSSPTSIGGLQAYFARIYSL
ncbi:MAG: FAD-dependent monooxygenase [Pseudomonadota bacterium]